MGSTDNAISYLDFSHFDDSKFTAIKVNGVAPESKNVLDNSFPNWATEHIYCAKDADDATKTFLEYMLSYDVQVEHMYCAKDADDATKAFLEYMLSDDVQGSLVEEQGFIPVSEMTVVKDAEGNVTKK